MQSLPWKARVFITGTYVIGMLSMVLAAFLPPPSGCDTNPWEYALFFLLANGLGWVTLHLLPQRHSASHAGCISLGFVIIFAAMLRFGPSAAVLLGISSTISTGIKLRHLWYQTLFNAAMTGIQTLVAGLAFLALNQGSVVLNLTDSLPALVASSLLFFLINSGSVAVVIALCGGGNAFHIWNEKFLWTGPGYFIGAAVSVVAIGMWGGQIPVTLLCLTPMIVITYLSFRTFVQRSDALTNSQQQLTDLYMATTRSLALAVDAKDRYTHQHIIRVQKYAMAIAREMKVTHGELQAIEIGALLHDIGKMGISEAVLTKPGRLTDEEFEEIKQHPRIGAEILEPVPFPWPVVPMVKYHHERWDGTGYPDRLRGEEIPLSARILAVADVYDALTSDRSYRGAWTHARACAEIEIQSGKQFDPIVVTAFLAIIDSVVGAPQESMIAPEVTAVAKPLPQPVMARTEEGLVPISLAQSKRPLFTGRPTEPLVTPVASRIIR